MKNLPLKAPPPPLRELSHFSKLVTKNLPLQIWGAPSFPTHNPPQGCRAHKKPCLEMLSVCAMIGTERRFR